MCEVRRQQGAPLRLTSPSSSTHTGLMQAACFTFRTSTRLGAQPQGAAAVRALHLSHLVLMPMFAINTDLAPGPQRHT